MPERQQRVCIGLPRTEDSKSMTRCIMLDMECAVICHFAAVSIAHSDAHTREICLICAKACQNCGSGWWSRRGYEPHIVFYNQYIRGWNIHLRNTTRQRMRPAPGLTTAANAPRLASAALQPFATCCTETRTHPPRLSLTRPACPLRKNRGCSEPFFVSSLYPFNALPESIR